MFRTQASLFWLFLGALLLAFQNCARPVGHQRYEQSSEVEQPEASTDSYLETRDGGDSVLSIEPAAAVFSSAKVAGTGQDEWAGGLFPTGDGGYISTGKRRVGSEAGTWKVLFQKWDSRGDLLYAVEIHDDWSNTGVRAIELPDAYLVVGSTYSRVVGEESGRRSDILLMKLNKETGEILNAKRLGQATTSERVDDVVLVNPNANPYLVAVGRYRDYTAQGQPNESKAFLLKMDLFLNLIWQRTFSVEAADLKIESVSYRSGYGFYTAGWLQNTNAPKKAMLMRFDENGGHVKTQVLNNSTQGDMVFRSIENSGGDLVLAGRHEGLRGTDGLIFRVSFDLNSAQGFTLGHEEGLDRLHSVKVTSDGGLVAAGASRVPGPGDLDSWIAKLDARGQLEFSKVFGGGSDDFSQHQSLVARRDSGYAFLVNSYSEEDPGTYDPLLLMLSQYGTLPEDCVQTKGEHEVEVKDLDAHFTERTDVNVETLSLPEEVLFDSSSDHFSEIVIENQAYCAME